MRGIASTMGPNHPDYQALAKIRDAIWQRSEGQENLQSKLPILITEAIDFVVDPVRTGRNALSELDNVEKTFVGLKIEHFLRDFLDVPKGLRDLIIDGMDVDVKNTVSATWMIPQETYRNADPCLLVASAEDKGRCWLGLMLARDAYLGKQNQDKKRGVVEAGFANIMWLVDGAELPQSHWKNIDMPRFRELRREDPGEKRAADFFRESIGRIIHRSIVEALLHDQVDYMKRVRGNGGARDILQPEGILVLNGHWLEDRAIAKAHGVEISSGEESVSVRVSKV
jgi:Restriction endonuclease NaeI